jgi:2-hydroxy-3-keto-5-methylthiopentenyl-1-phosphate phosphatase
MQYLQYKDTRSCIKWCSKNGVKVFFVANGKKPFVLKVEFEAAANKDVVKYLRNKYGINKLEKGCNLFSTIIQERMGAVAVKNKSVSHYKPSGQHEKSFLTSLLNETHEL